MICDYYHTKHYKCTYIIHNAIFGGDVFLCTEVYFTHPHQFSGNWVGSYEIKITSRSTWFQYFGFGITYK